MKKKTLALLLCIGVSSAIAQTTIGSRSCGEWLSRSDGDTSNRSTVESVAATGWLMGYMSGIAMGRQENILKEVDGKSIYAWMDNYCRAHPLEHVYKGGNELAQELSKRIKR